MVIECSVTSVSQITRFSIQNQQPVMGPSDVALFLLSIINGTNVFQSEPFVERGIVFTG